MNAEGLRHLLGEGKLIIRGMSPLLEESENRLHRSAGDFQIVTAALLIAAHVFPLGRLYCRMAVDHRARITLQRVKAPLSPRLASSVSRAPPGVGISGIEGGEGIKKNNKKTVELYPKVMAGSLARHKVCH